MAAPGSGRFRSRRPAGRSIGSVVLDWRGEEVKTLAREAAKVAITQTMEAAVDHAKRNHLGWNNRTGNLEGSLGIRRKPKESGRYGVAGNWGSNVRYSFFIERRYGFLQAAAAVTYPQLGERIAAQMKPNLDE